MLPWYNIHTCDKKYFDNLGDQALKIIKDLFPICRSLTGTGNKQTLEYLSQIIPLNMCDIKSGTQVFDWVIPDEWELCGAKIIGPDGNIVISSDENNLHVVSYSIPVHTKMSLGDLKKHIHTRPDMPDVIPYVTSYYERRWGFCMTDTQLKSLRPGTYEVLIDSNLSPGKMCYADYCIDGKSKEEILLSTYFCHPSMANDNLSGLVLTTLVLKELSKISELNFSYRGVFVPETVGAVTYLHEYKDHFAKRLKAGLVVTCVGDSGEEVTYKKSRQGNSEIDRAVEHLLRLGNINHKIMDFMPIGSDERQYCSPGFNLPVGSLMRTHYYDLPYYHTSGDNIDTISSENIGNMIWLYLRAFSIIENNGVWCRIDSGFCELQLSKRNLYPSLGAQPHNRSATKHVAWALNMADGSRDILEIANMANIPFWEILEIMKKLEKSGVVKKI